MDTVIYKGIPRVSPSVVESLRGLSVADLHEALGSVKGVLGLMSSSFRPLLPGATIIGPAVTAFNTPGDNLMMHCALHYAQKGDVLVMTGSGGALWGENSSLQALEKGIAGIVVEGAVRDTDSVREMKFPAWSTVVSVSHPERRSHGAVNIPIVCGGVIVRPGDIIVADSDGVLVLPPAEVAGVVERARERMAKEVKLREAIRRGETMFDYLGIQRVLSSIDAKIVDGAWE